MASVLCLLLVSSLAAVAAFFLAFAAAIAACTVAMVDGAPV